jgi:8-oxo-dGTP pyrophosphatase MutT (NUDIX family)
MKNLYKIYVQSGLIGYKIVLPLMRVFISRTERAYIMLIDEDKILMTKNWLSNGLWALPGGGIRYSETPQQAIIREAKEEIKVELTDIGMKLAGQGVWKTDSLGFSYKIFKARYNPGLFKPNGHEITDVRWILINDLNETNTASELLGIIRLNYCN